MNLLARVGCLLACLSIASCGAAPQHGKLPGDGVPAEPVPPQSVPAAPPTDWAQQAGPAIAASLAWLSAHQDEDGRWDADGFMKHDLQGSPCDGPGNAVHDVGATSLALLAMLANGNTMRSGQYKDSVRMAVSWLKAQQQENGLIGANASFDFIYDHAIATWAICEAYGLSSYKALKPVAQKALNYLESHRNPYAVWRYQPRDNDNDTSVTTWATLALCSGKFFGLEVNPNSIKMAEAWFAQVTDANGRAGYTKAGERSSRMPGNHSQNFPVGLGEAITAAALTARFMLGQTPDQHPEMAKSAELLLASPPKWQADRVDPYYWYFGTTAMYQTGGEAWAKWSPHLAALVEHQCKDGNAAGSWDPVGVWDEVGGRIAATALHTLTLQSVHRYAKVVRAGQPGSNGANVDSGTNVDGGGK